MVDTSALTRIEHHSCFNEALPALRSVSGDLVGRLSGYAYLALIPVAYICQLSTIVVNTSQEQ